MTSNYNNSMENKYKELTGSLERPVAEAAATPLAIAAHGPAFLGLPSFPFGFALLVVAPSALQLLWLCPNFPHFPHLREL